MQQGQGSIQVETACRWLIHEPVKWYMNTAFYLLIGGIVATAVLVLPILFRKEFVRVKNFILRKKNEKGY
jgi:hypothetical protein